MPHQKNNLESYPPVFRQLNDTAAAEVKKNAMEETVPIPVVDLQNLGLEKLREASKDWGLFRLVNHGIPETLLSKLEEQAKKMFSLPFESKQALLSSPMSYFWGTPVLTPTGDALKGAALNINWLEGVNVPLSQLPQFQSQDPVLDCFRVLLEEYGRHLGRIATTLFEAMVKDLNLDPKQSESNIDESTGFIRVYRYPAGVMAEEAWGMIAHTDSSVLSIVNQDKVAGLEIFKDNKWQLVNPVPNTLIVHIGDMMQAISDDEYISVKHRVRVNKQEERFSICYFVFPAEGSVIRSSKYRPFTYADFQEHVQKDLKTIGYKVGLDRFKVNADG
ncbi:Oxoglutarate/iron-dependent dioxygenase [Corchorus capsularis]|uniref:Oxoglutarate/iron-dependent dioxygenase n=1 Tax=Corchorus capsularis TaxID=210143 RepID=A0A1R3IP43_COCAP|nr:Oxoglutarate/iron-dependent dioxygenase [Corchorus capsularis]